MNILFPKTQKQVQRFLGCLKFISPFIPNFANTFRHIFRMSHKVFNLSVKVQDDTAYETEWTNAKKHLVHTATDYFPRKELEWVLHTDASTTGFGGVLVQLMPLEELTQGEQAQASVADMVDERQLVAVPIAFESLLILISFVIETDHKNLVSLTEGTLGSSPRCARWRHYISRFMYAIRHIPGARNIMADFFSRYVLPQDPQMPTTLAAITGSLMGDTESEEEDMPTLVTLARQGIETLTDFITDILCEYAVDTDPEILVTALQKSDDKHATC